jgi:hypothetical protein
MLIVKQPGNLIGVGCTLTLFASILIKRLLFDEVQSLAFPGISQIGGQSFLPPDDEDGLQRGNRGSQAESILDINTVQEMAKKILT